MIELKYFEGSDVKQLIDWLVQRNFCYNGEG